MRIQVIVALCFSLLGLGQGRAGNEGLHGGDEDGLAATYFFFGAYNDFRTYLPDDFKMIAAKNLASIQQLAAVIMTEDPLDCPYDSACVARADRGQFHVLIHRQRWLDVSESIPRMQAIVFHQFAVLAGLETEENRPYTSRYLDLFGLPKDAIYVFEDSKASLVASGAQTSEHIPFAFHQAFLRAFDWLSEFQPDLLGARRNEVMRAFAKAKIKVTDKTLTVDISGLQQESSAVNNPIVNVIRVNSKSWLHSDPYLQEALALHEILSLVGLESGGRYPISAKYLSLAQSPYYGLSRRPSPIMYRTNYTDDIERVLQQSRHQGWSFNLP